MKDPKQGLTELTDALQKLVVGPGQENQDKLNNCQPHAFVPVPPTSPGRGVTHVKCRKCGGELSMHSFTIYSLGLRDGRLDNE